MLQIPYLIILIFKVNLNLKYLKKKIKKNLKEL